MGIAQISGFEVTKRVCPTSEMRSPSLFCDINHSRCQAVTVGEMKLNIKSVSIHYKMKRTQKLLLAADRISFCVGSGEFVAIVGPSGCGKTSLLHAIAGLLPITSGEIQVDGKPITGPGTDRAMVFQSPALLPWRTVLRNVTYGLELQGIKPQAAAERAQQYINLVGLQGFAQSFPNELSGGMQQRVNLARALAVQPSLLLLDEPLSALDAQTRELMQVELQRIWLESRHSALYITHQIDEAIFLADKVIVMSARPGRVEQVVAVELPRPRPLAIKREVTFVQLVDRIWQLLQLDTGFRATTDATKERDARTY